MYRYIYIRSQSVCSLPFSSLTVKPTRLRAVVYSTLRFHHLCIRRPYIMYSTRHAVAPRVPCIICVFLPLPMATACTFGQTWWWWWWLLGQLSERMCSWRIRSPSDLVSSGSGTHRCVAPYKMFCSSMCIFLPAAISFSPNPPNNANAVWWRTLPAGHTNSTVTTESPYQQNHQQQNLDYIHTEGSSSSSKHAQVQTRYTHHAYKTTHKMYAPSRSHKIHSLSLVCWAEGVGEIEAEERTLINLLRLHHTHVHQTFPPQYTNTEMYTCLKNSYTHE